MKILLVEDEPTLSQNIRQALEAEHMLVDYVFDGALAERFFKNNYDCIILDINLPGKNGLELCRSFRAIDKHTPVLLLTAFDELEDKVKGFEAGADDYLTKPFFMKELVLRIQSLNKRALQTTSGRQEQAVISFDDIRIDLHQKKVFRQEQEILLTPREYQILYRLMENPGELVSKATLMEDIWGQSVGMNTNTIEVYINFLRNKIDKPFGKSSIKTKIGYGYYIQ
ncbi:MAG: DNA-binding response regulator [Bacteroidetes bacterium 43-16]|mgnify:CR=1 FL=1|nr:MAG: DNA-binding response regulator [Bacteroidetes bacterium 43-16]